MLEHKNNYLKDMLRHQHANVTFESAKVASQSYHTLQTMVRNFSSELSIRVHSGKHSVANRSSDINKIAEIALKNNLTANTPGRTLNAFPIFKPSLQNLSREKLLTWIEKHRKIMHDFIEQR